MKMNLKVLLLFLSLTTYFWSSLTHAKDFDAEAERNQLLELFQTNLNQTFIIQNKNAATPEALKFINYYIEEIYPTSLQFRTLNLKLSALQILLDRALFDSETQKEEWISLTVKLKEEWNHLGMSSTWKKKIHTFYELSHGLNGPLVDLAKSFYEEEIKFNLDESFKDLTKELTEIQARISNIANTSKYADLANKQSVETQNILIAFRKGKLSYKEASAKLKRASYLAYLKYGHDISSRSAEDLKRQAVIFSKMAKAKGYSNWAEFQIAQEAKNYGPPFDTALGRIQFLEQLLNNTDDIFKTLISLRKQQLGLATESPVYPHEKPLLSFSNTPNIKDFFLKENFLKIWQSTMMKAGFSERMTAAINIDANPRPGKYNSAYLFPALEKYPQKVFIDALILNESYDSDESHFLQPQAYWLQNDVLDGLMELNTTFHEGGHALDFIHREPSLLTYDSSSYNETHSTFMENFLIDRDFLLAIGKNRHRKRISSKIVDQYLENQLFNNLFSLRYTIGNALFDLKLWDYDFETGSESFLDRAHRLYGETSSRANFTTPPKSKVPWQDHLFTTSHFYSGSVNYIGYVNAAIAADILKKYFLDYFETTTGRRTLYEQPQLAELLIHGFYKQGQSQPFPIALENFTQSRLDAKVFTENLIKEIHDSLLERSQKDCTSYLSTF